MKAKYYLYYDTLGWAAYIVKSPKHPQPEESLWRGPCDTAREIRELGKKLIDQDIDQFMLMKREILRGKILDLTKNGGGQ